MNLISPSSQRDDFHQQHGAFVTLPNDWLLFEDGAVDQSSQFGVGPLVDPPEDEYALAVNKFRYLQIVAEHRVQQFEAYKSFLGGNGYSDFIAYTEEEKLEHLEDLKRIARSAKRKADRAKRAMEELAPEEDREIELYDAELAYRHRQFLDQVESVNL